MSDKQTIADLEKSTGFFVRDLEKYNLNDTMTEEEYIAYVNLHLIDFHLVNYLDRVKFLEDNDYEVTRENLMDGELSARNYRPPADNFVEPVPISLPEAPQEPTATPDEPGISVI